VPNDARELSLSPDIETPSGGDILSKVSFLSRPDSYPEHPVRVDIIETH
jgi:hypothetical protein